MDNSPLSRLPAELRNTIYTLVLVTGKETVLCETNDNESFHWQPPALLHACSQLRLEASPIYYAANIFTVNCKLRENFEELHERTDAALAAWLRDALDAQARSLVREVRLLDDVYEDYQVAPRIRRCEEILEAEGGRMEHGKIFVLQLTEKFFARMKEKRITSDPDDDDAVWATA